METQPESSQRCGEVAPSGISIEEETGAAARTLEGGSHGFPVLSVSFHFPRSGGKGEGLAQQMQGSQIQVLRSGGLGPSNSMGREAARDPPLLDPNPPGHPCPSPASQHLCPDTYDFYLMALGQSSLWAGAT